MPTVRDRVLPETRTERDLTGPAGAVVDVVTEQLDVMESRHAQQRHLAVFALLRAALSQDSPLLV